MQSYEVNEFNQPIGFKVDNWQGRKPPERKPQQGHYCKLIPIDINEHGNELINVLLKDNPGDSWTYLPSGPFDTYDEFKNWLQIKLQEKTTILYVITDIVSGKILGMSGYLRICEEHGVGEIGHLHFSKQLKRTRIATEAIYLMMSYLFDTLLYRRCEWKCHDLNNASKKAAERYGFKFEGVFRQNHVFKHRNRDTAWFSVLDYEWPQLKIKFNKWLNPYNFDEHGVQRVNFRDI